MRKHVVKVRLSTDGVQNAIDELNRYKQDLIKKLDTLQNKIAEKLRDEASVGFNNAILDDVLKGEARKPEVDVSISNQGAVTVVIASGEDAIWVEFGAGVYHNGSVGSSPHPHGKELGYTIGGYGKGNGKKEVWGYYNEDDSLVFTHGTPATMPMSKSFNNVLNEFPSIVREVFG